MFNALSAQPARDWMPVPELRLGRFWRGSRDRHYTDGLSPEVFQAAFELSPVIGKGSSLRALAAVMHLRLACRGAAVAVGDDHFNAPILLSARRAIVVRNRVAFAEPTSLDPIPCDAHARQL